MNYVAWSDARGKEENGSFLISYVIQTKSGKTISKLTAHTGKSIESKQEAKCFAFYLLLKEIDKLQLDLGKTIVYTDSLSVKKVFLTQTYSIVKERFRFLEALYNECGKLFYSRICKQIRSKERNKNKAFSLCKYKNRLKTINVPANCKKKSTNSRRKKSELLGEFQPSTVIPIPHTTCTIEGKTLLNFHKKMTLTKKHPTERSLEILSKRMNEAAKIQQGKFTIYVREYLHIYVENNKVQYFVFKKSQWSKEYKKIKSIS